MRRNRRHQLNDDRGRDVGHDVQGENGHAPERATRKAVHPAENARGLLLHEPRKLQRVDARDRNVGTETVDDQGGQREPDALLEFFRLGQCRKIDVGCQLFRCRCHG